MCVLLHPAPVVGMGGAVCFWVVFVLPLSAPGGQLLLPAVVELVLVPVPCGHDGELSGKFGNWPVPTEERGWDAKYSVTRGILAFMRLSCPIQTGAPRMRSYTWFLYLSSIQVQRDLPNHYLTRTRTLLFCKATLILWCRHPSDSFLIQPSPGSVLLQFLISDAR